MAAAVALDPENVGVVIPRGATLLTASQQIPGDAEKATTADRAGRL